MTDRSDETKPGLASDASASPPSGGTKRLGFICFHKSTRPRVSSADAQPSKRILRPIDAIPEVPADSPEVPFFMRRSK